MRGWKHGGIKKTNRSCCCLNLKKRWLGKKSNEFYWLSRFSFFLFRWRRIKLELFVATERDKKSNEQKVGWCDGPQHLDDLDKHDDDDGKNNWVSGQILSLLQEWKEQLSFLQLSASFFSDFCAKLAKRFLGEVMPKCSVYNSPSKLGTTFSCRLGILKMKKQTAKTFQRKKWFSVRFGKQRKQAWRLTARWWWWLLVVDKFAADEKEGTEKELGFGRFCFFPVQKRLWKKLFFLSV